MSCINAAIVEFDLTKLPEQVEAACDAIHQYRIRKHHALSAAEHSELDEAFDAKFSLRGRSSPSALDLLMCSTRRARARIPNARFRADVCE